MQLISKLNKGFKFLLGVIDIFSKYAWVVLLKDEKKVLVLLMLFKNFRWFEEKTEQDMGWQRKRILQ